MIIHRPAKGLVEAFIGILPAGLHPLAIPRVMKTPPGEWYKNHRSYVLQQLLPSIRPPIDVWQVCAEAYLTDVSFNAPHSNFYLDGVSVVPGRKYAYEEVLSDGTSLVPDLAYKWGKIKDPWALAHDLLFMLHDYSLPDVFGRKRGFFACNDLYRRGWVAQKHRVIGNVWWAGLTLGSWVPWLKPANCIPECRTFEDSCLPICPECVSLYAAGKYDSGRVCEGCLRLWSNGRM